MSVGCDVNEVTHLWFPAMKRQLEREKMVQVYGLVSLEVSYRYQSPIIIYTLFAPSQV